ncbi:hypothetical protein MTR67_013375 [Solanum verrucosum]|uniref:Uncharacterized protein n=1 Tax=Solanum verrucosum TaxID=315347 RepID=A0AAF0TNS5_SOLVR|nr:hypothetical protein MTR67_013375 [Solanum verrucosum]
MNTCVLHLLPACLVSPQLQLQTRRKLLNLPSVWEKPIFRSLQIVPSASSSSSTSFSPAEYPVIWTGNNTEVISEDITKALMDLDPVAIEDATNKKVNEYELVLLEVQGDNRLIYSLAREKDAITTICPMNQGNKIAVTEEEPILG